MGTCCDWKRELCDWDEEEEDEAYWAVDCAAAGASDAGRLVWSQHFPPFLLYLFLFLPLFVSSKVDMI